MAKSLRDITEELGKDQKSTADSVQELNSLFKKYFQKLERQSGDQEEDRREAKRQAAKSTSGPGSQIASINNSLGLLPIGGILGALMPITAGIAAVTGALAGLRGWEVSALKNIGQIKNLIPNNINNAMIRLRNGIYKVFGLTPEGLPERNPQTGAFMKRRPIGEQILGKMKSLRADFLRVFGLGLDGKPIAVQDPDGLFKRNIIGRVTFQIGRLLKPLMRVSEGVAKFATGAGKGLFEFISKFITPLGGVAKLAGKILWPIGFIMSAFDGMEAYRNSDADGFIAKLGAGIGGFLGSFIGAPFDLLKSGINWVFDKIFGVKRDENGNVVGDGWAQWASRAMSEFSFQSTISSVVSGMFGMVQGAVDWVKLLFSNPSEALDKLWTGLLSTIKVGGQAAAGLLDILWYPVNSLVDWATKKFGWRDEDAPKFNLRETITGWVTDFWTWFTSFLPDISVIAADLTNRVKSLMPDWLAEQLGMSDTPQDVVNKLAMERALSQLRAADTNNDGVIDQNEVSGPYGYQFANISDAINKINELRGGEVITPAAIRSGGGTFVINNVDASTNSANVTKQAPRQMAPAVQQNSAYPF